MNQPIEVVRISKQGKDQLSRLKTRTKMTHWNEICRWAFCLSVVEATKPQEMKINFEEGVEMTWKVFGGPYHDIYLALLRERCRKDGLELTDDMLANQFRLHLHRGIGYLFADKGLRTIENLFEKIPNFRRSTPLAAS